MLGERTSSPSTVSLPVFLLKSSLNICAVNPPVVHHSYLSIKGRQGLWCSWCDVRLREMLDNVMRVSQQSQGLQHTLIVLSSAQFWADFCLLIGYSLIILYSDWLFTKWWLRERPVFGSHVWLHCEKSYTCRGSDDFIGPIRAYHQANVTQSEARSARVINWSNWSNYCLTSDLTSASDRLQT